MEKSTIWTVAIILVIVLGVGFLLVSNGGSSGVKQVQAAVVAEQTSHDFGEIDIFGGKVNTTYTLKNIGTEDVSILSAVTSCMCTEGEIGGLQFGMHESSGSDVIIPAGEEKILTATFDPLAHGPEGVGKVTRELFLKTNSTVTSEIKVTFTANVVKSGSKK